MYAKIAEYFRVLTQIYVRVWELWRIIDRFPVQLDLSELKIVIFLQIQRFLFSISLEMQKRDNFRGNLFTKSEILAAKIQKFSSDSSAYLSEDSHFVNPFRFAKKTWIQDFLNIGIQIMWILESKWILRFKKSESE